MLRHTSVLTGVPNLFGWTDVVGGQGFPPATPKMCNFFNRGFRRPSLMMPPLGCIKEAAKTTGICDDIDDDGWYWWWWMMIGITVDDAAIRCSCQGCIRLQSPTDLLSAARGSGWHMLEVPKPRQQASFAVLPIYCCQSGMLLLMFLIFLKNFIMFCLCRAWLWLWDLWESALPGEVKRTMQIIAILYIECNAMYSTIYTYIRIYVYNEYIYIYTHTYHYN